jgi:hypothetical protein
MGHDLLILVGAGGVLGATLLYKDEFHGLIYPLLHPFATFRARQKSKAAVAQRARNVLRKKRPEPAPLTPLPPKRLRKKLSKASIASISFPDPPLPEILPDLPSHPEILPQGRYSPEPEILPKGRYSPEILPKGRYSPEPEILPKGRYSPEILPKGSYSPEILPKSLPKALSPVKEMGDGMYYNEKAGSSKLDGVKFGSVKWNGEEEDTFGGDLSSWSDMMNKTRMPWDRRGSAASWSSRRDTAFDGMPLPPPSTYRPAARRRQSSSATLINSLGVVSIPSWHLPTRPIAV